jgi:hypothetical protein
LRLFVAVTVIDKQARLFLNPDRAMDARVEIMALLRQYCVGFDEGDSERAAACFVDDGVMEIDIAGGTTVGPFEGRDAVRGLLDGSLEQVAEGEQRRHMLSNVHVELLEEDRGTVHSYLLVTTVRDGAPAILTTGWQRDEIRRVAAGWRIASRHLHVDNPF